MQRGEEAWLVIGKWTGSGSQAKPGRREFDHDYDDDEEDELRHNIPRLCVPSRLCV
ncbi:MAG TPA: hypothetical protein VNZ64_23355 [Candidatus Acidoferrum sp.]|jgi:hypothetical protein|nr:hypothetical protein [Candidatus Acidoferrum sp.]